jgi:hypothetical protein
MKATPRNVDNVLSCVCQHITSANVCIVFCCVCQRIILAAQ